MSSRLTRGLSIAAAAAVAAPVLAAALPAAPAHAASVVLDSYDREMFELVNAERAAAGLPALEWFEPARPTATSHSADMMASGAFAHDQQLEAEMGSVGCTYVGENIFYERKGDYRRGLRSPEPSYSMSRYMDSAGHRANVLRPDYTHFVAGTVYDQATGLLYNTQRFAGDCPEVPTAPAPSSTEFQLDLGVRTQTVSLGIAGDAFVAGDWDGDGVDTPAVREINTFTTTDLPAATGAQNLTAYGRPGDTVYVGDWDGDGVDTFAVRRGNTFYLSNDFRGGEASIVTAYGRPDDEVVVGDWDGDGVDTPAVRRGNVFYLKNSFAGGEADIVLGYGRATDAVYAGDWDGDGLDTLVVRRGNTYYFSDTFEGGIASRERTFGRADDATVVGDWTGSGSDSIGVARTS